MRGGRRGAALAVPGIAHVAEQYKQHAGKELTASALARLLADKQSSGTKKAATNGLDRVLSDLEALSKAAEQLALRVGWSKSFEAHERAAEALRSGSSLSKAVKILERP